MSSQVFRNAETEFRAWLAKNPSGFVVNTTAKPSERYFVLHRADCTTLHRDVPPGGYTERDYIKACSSDATPTSLELWVHQIGGPGFTKVCAVCKPATAEPAHQPLPAHQAEFEKQVEAARKLAPADRAKLLEAGTPTPSFYITTTIAYARSPYVVAAVLERAKGVCEACEAKAPFNRRFDGSPYLEVHHRVRLADGGHDTVENALALCPNCHRKAHFGTSDG